MIPHSRPTIGIEEKKACEAVLDSLEIAQGRKVEEFEKKFAAFTGRRAGIAVSSGSAALQLALSALRLSRGDQVIVPSFTCVALLHAVDQAGARPVVGDIDPEDFNLAVEEVKKKITRKTKAMIVPHSFGRAARMRELLRFGIPVIEDGTQALGAHEDGRPVGSFGVMSIFSFYATKMITTGEGGMVLTDSRRLAAWVLDRRDYDKKEKYLLRTNSKMTDLEAAMGIEQLKKLPLFIARRREIAARYHEAFQGKGLILPSAGEGRDHVFYRYVLRIPQKTPAWIRNFREEQIDAKRPFFKPLHRYLDFPDARFPQTVKAMKEACSLPIYPSLDDEACRAVCRAAETGRLSEKVPVLIP